MENGDDDSAGLQNAHCCRETCESIITRIIIITMVIIMKVSKYYASRLVIEEGCSKLLLNTVLL
jgi:hypothetical protein